MAEPSVKPTVTWEDQQNINKFSNAFQRQGELEAQIQYQKKLVDDLEDAGNELMLAEDDDEVKMQVGQCFWATSKDEAESKLQQLTDAATQELKQLEQQLKEVQGVMSELRTKLYARLGDSINLDVPRSSAAASKA